MGRANQVKGLADLLTEKKDLILQMWFDAIIETYPAQTAKFLKSKKDRFANPVGQSILEGTGGIFDDLTKYLAGQKIDPAHVSLFLDNIIRVRAIQDFTPSGAVWFIFQLKQVVRRELAAEIREDQNSNTHGGLRDELTRLDYGIDELALLSFDIFMKCREQIYQIKTEEEKRKLYRLLQQARIITGEDESVNDSQRGHDESKFKGKGVTE
jgi:hypothetical protein